jgi:hypothetical protein
MYFGLRTICRDKSLNHVPLMLAGAAILESKSGDERKNIDDAPSNGNMMYKPPLAKSRGIDRQPDMMGMLN